jgi:hypothetical protein
MYSKSIIAIISLFMMGCSFSAKESASQDRSTNSDSYAGLSKVDMEPTTDTKERVPTSEREKSNPFLIYTGRLGIQTGRYEEVYSHVQRVTNQLGGYVSSEEEESDDYAVRNNLILRMPSDKFHRAVTMLSQITDKIDGNTVIYKTIESEDVTEEFLDVEARIKTKKSVEQRYLAILRQAKTVKEILAVEADLRVIREEIEAKEGRLRYLKNRVGYSTIHVFIEQIKEEGSIQSEENFGDKLIQAIKSGWSGVENVFVGIMYIWPVFILLLVGFLLLRKRLRMRKS